MRHTHPPAPLAVIALTATLLGSASAPAEPPIEFEGWHEPEQVDVILGTFEAEHDSVSLIQFGSTASEDDVPLYVVRLADPDITTPRPDVVFVSLHHVREWITVEAALCLLELFVNELESTNPQDPELQVALKNVEVWIVPVLNPDGYAHSWKTKDEKNKDGRFWRKNRREIWLDDELKGVGVDLNRNYPFNWNEADDPSDELYPGPSPSSEKEVTAFIDLVTGNLAQASTLDHPSALLSYHSYGSLFLGPWVHDLNAPLSAGFDGDVLLYTIRNSMLRINQFAWEDYEDQTGLCVWSGINGDAADFFWNEHHIASFSIELPPKMDCSQLDDLAPFDLSPELIHPSILASTSVATALVKDVGLRKVWIRDHEFDLGTEPSATYDEDKGTWDHPMRSPDIDVEDQKITVKIQNATEHEMHCRLDLFDSDGPVAEGAPLVFPDGEPAFYSTNVVVPAEGLTFIHEWTNAWTPREFVAAVIFHPDDRPLSNRVHMTNNMACWSPEP